MKYNVKIAMLVLGILMMAFPGCKKHSCFHCYLLSGAFEYSKNGDTIATGPIPNQQWLQDSLNFIINKGYTIDWISDYYQDAGTICDTPQGPYRIFPDSCIFSYYKQ